LFYNHLTQTWKLFPKPVLFGFGRGGLYALNWAARHPENVCAIYLDAPVCDFKSWPAGMGRSERAKQEWAQLLRAYGFDSEKAALDYKKNPIDNLAPLAAARVPILSVVGTADVDAPMEENTVVLATRYRALGGQITVIQKEGAGHCPHGLEDPMPIVDFVLNAQKQCLPEKEKAAPKIEKAK
jgi:pimeloyl-ACP methyl ester carboxylesterase